MSDKKKLSKKKSTQENKNITDNEKIEINEDEIYNIEEEICKLNEMKNINERMKLQNILQKKTKKMMNEINRLAIHIEELKTDDLFDDGLIDNLDDEKISTLMNDIAIDSEKCENITSLKLRVDIYESMLKKIKECRKQVNQPGKILIDNLD
jgi:uncharacterized protein YerC